MEKKDVDQYFTKNEKEIKHYIRSRFFSKNIREEEPDYFFSELYAFIIGRKDLITDDKKLKDFISNFIYMNTHWANSQYRELGSRQKTDKVVPYTDGYGSTLVCKGVDMDRDSFKEPAVYDYQSISELYYDQLQDSYLKASWEIVFIHGKSNITKYAQHIGRGKTIASRCLNDLKEDMSKFYVEYTSRQSWSPQQYL